MSPEFPCILEKKEREIPRNMAKISRKTKCCSKNTRRWPERVIDLSAALSKRQKHAGSKRINEAIKRIRSQTLKKL